ncbi:MAG: hypothetical protein CYPHOPRED_004316 [Cyphobasidiales sp. Tagirdzhanova-0007]|nr:MAG: hypothetical protein CYPHOPRED_004316 [Cyphobasidiales sp. Tagirdzhanova-0007]
MAAERPMFSHLHLVTSDHLDTVVFDPHGDHHPLDDEDVEREVPQQDDSSDQTVGREEREGLSTGPGKDVSNQAEKGQFRRRNRSTTETGQQSRNPETRKWKDDIITFDSRDDPANPKNWPYSRKVFVTGLYGMTTMSSTFASSVFSPALPYIAKQYGISSEASVLGISLFVLGYVPELYGRKISIVLPMFIFACFSIATATAENVQTIMITRFFAGVFGSAPVSNVGGGLADMWDVQERATAVVFYSLSVVAGPSLGPIVGGAVSQSYLGWRWTEYIAVILTMVVVGLDIIFIPETFAPILLTRKAQQLRWKTGRYNLHSRQEMTTVSLSIFLHKNLLLPIKMILLEPMVLCITLFNAFAYGILYLLFAAVPIIFEEGRGWNTLVGTLPFIAVLLGCLAAGAINYAYSQLVFKKIFEKSEGRVEPELRLPTMCLGSIFFPVGFLILGWTSNPHISWFPSTIGLFFIFFIGMSFLLIFQAGLKYGWLKTKSVQEPDVCTSYLIDAYTKVSASAVASNTFMRSLLAYGIVYPFEVKSDSFALDAVRASLPLVAMPLFHNLGVSWACTLLGCVSILLAGIPFVLLKYGKEIRSYSKFAGK